MKKSLLINIGICLFICMIIVVFEAFWGNEAVNNVLLGIYFCVPVGMVVLTIIELALYKKNQRYIHIVDIIKFDVFFILALLSLVAEGAKALEFSVNIALGDIIAGLATLVALDRVLVFAKIAFVKKFSENADAEKKE